MVSNKLKKSIQSEKKFLSKLYLCDKKYQKKKLLKSASEKQLEILLNVLHLIVVGEIPIKKFHFETVKKSKRLPFVMTLQDNLSSLLEGTRRAKEDFLCNISTYREMLHMLFNRE